MKSRDISLIEKWVHRWGCSVSEAVLDSHFHYFLTPNIEGFIGYRAESGNAVVIGDPICPIEDMPCLTRDFHCYCQEKKMNIIYMIASESFAKWLIQQRHCNVMVEIGEELIFDPQYDPREGPHGSKLRNTVNHAHHLGLTVNEYLSHDVNLEHAIQQAGIEWLQGRRGPQIHLTDLDFFDIRTGKRWFYVKNATHMMGIALISKIEARQGWLLKSLIAVPGAPRGTSELLMTKVLDTLRGEDCHFLTYGIVPAKDLGEITGLGKCSTWLLKNGYKMVKWIFKLDQRQIYWQKFHPRAERNYLLFSQPYIDFQGVRSIFKSLKINL